MQANKKFTSVIFKNAFQKLEKNDFFQKDKLLMKATIKDIKQFKEFIFLLNDFFKIKNNHYYHGDIVLNFDENCLKIFTANNNGECEENENLFFKSVTFFENATSYTNFFDEKIFEIDIFQQLKKFLKLKTIKNDGIFELYFYNKNVVFHDKNNDIILILKEKIFDDIDEKRKFLNFINSNCNLSENEKITTLNFALPKFNGELINSVEKGKNPFIKLQNEMLKKSLKFSENHLFMSLFYDKENNFKQSNNPFACFTNGHRSIVYSNALFKFEEEAVNFETFICHKNVNFFTKIVEAKLKNAEEISTDKEFLLTIYKNKNVFKSYFWNEKKAHESTFFEYVNNKHFSNCDSIEIIMDQHSVYNKLDNSFFKDLKEEWKQWEEKHETQKINFFGLLNLKTNKNKIITQEINLLKKLPKEYMNNYSIILKQCLNNPNLTTIGLKQHGNDIDYCLCEQDYFLPNTNLKESLCFETADNFFMFLDLYNTIASSHPAKQIFKTDKNGKIVGGQAMAYIKKRDLCNLINFNLFNWSIILLEPLS